MLKKRDVLKFSGFLCKLLRHNPHEFQLQMDDYGYMNISDMLYFFQSDPYWGEKINYDVLLWVVEQDQKQRYEWDKEKIRALYGHSVPVILPHRTKQLPDVLYHGSHRGALFFIQEKSEGILPMDRQSVHLSEGTAFATLAAKRRKNPVIITVDTALARKENVKIEFAGNEVWLSTPIPASCIISVTDIA